MTDVGKKTVRNCVIEWENSRIARPVDQAVQWDRVDKRKKAIPDFSPHAISVYPGLRASG
jgi:hypothetical protein